MNYKSLILKLVWALKCPPMCPNVCLGTKMLAHVPKRMPRQQNAHPHTQACTWAPFAYLPPLVCLNVHQNAHPSAQTRAQAPECARGACPTVRLPAFPNVGLGTRMPAGMTV